MVFIYFKRISQSCLKGLGRFGDKEWASVSAKVRHFAFLKCHLIRHVRLTVVFIVIGLDSLRFLTWLEILTYDFVCKGIECFDVEPFYFAFFS